HTREPLTLRQFIEEPDTGGYAGVALDILEAVKQHHHQADRGVDPESRHARLFAPGRRGSRSAAT
ncbi:hypothetical protein QWY92_18230, partial [Algibacter miyuki]|uniref:hypothetical protein n=1 Tax=Algibacter miyuki TaxID=1306933 RepID=UPI0025B4951A